MIINKALIITGVYYLSVAAAGFLVFIIVLAIIKYIIYVLLFIFTAGKLKFWIFPNLTEDVGFFESFWPAYVYTYDKPKKAKDSDDEESSEEESEEDEKGNSDSKLFFVLTNGEKYSHLLTASLFHFIYFGWNPVTLNQF